MAASPCGAAFLSILAGQHDGQHSDCLRWISRVRAVILQGSIEQVDLPEYSPDVGMFDDAEIMLPVGIIICSEVIERYDGLEYGRPLRLVQCSDAGAHRAPSFLWVQRGYDAELLSRPHAERSPVLCLGILNKHGVSDRKRGRLLRA